MNYAVAYLTVFAAFVAFDAAWLTTMAPRFYRPVLGDMLAANFAIAPAVLFYLIYPVGLMIFAIAPGVRSASLATTLGYAALFGFFTYATYDLTNHATLRNWTWQLTVVDTAWGTLLATIAAAAGYWATTKAGGLP